jgi:Tetratricopeptide repeat
MNPKTWAFVFTLAFATLVRGATNDLTTILQKGLFEEEANRNLDAAIASYQALVSQFDKDREVAAMAVFRLGECYRRLGRTDDAIGQYERIVRDFADQATLLTLSRQNLAQLRPRPAASRTRLAPLEEVKADLERARTQVAAIEALPSTNRTEGLVALFANDESVEAFVRERTALTAQLNSLRATFSEDHPAVKGARSQIQVNETKLKKRIEDLVADRYKWRDVLEKVVQHRESAPAAGE